MRQVCRLQSLRCGTSVSVDSFACSAYPSHKPQAAAVAKVHSRACTAHGRDGTSCSTMAGGRWRGFRTSIICQNANGHSASLAAGGADPSGPAEESRLQHSTVVDPAASPQARLGTSASVPAKSTDALLKQLNVEEQRQLKVLQCEYDALMAVGIRMPSHVTDEQWLHLVRERHTKSSRMQYYKYLATRERHVESERLHKERRREAQQETMEKLQETRQKELIPGTPYYYAPRNTLFNRIYPKILRQVDDYRVAYAMQFGQPIVFDMGFGSHMSPKEHSSLHTELLYLIHHNRAMREPFHMHWCNINYDDSSMRMFEKLTHVTHPLDEDDDVADNGVMPPNTNAVRKGWWADQFLMTTTDRCYTELFAKQNLVYLSPHATEVMESFDTDAIYIIGGLVDLGPQGPLSLAKAKRQGIRAMKLPLDYYVKWKLARKSLGINHVFGMLKELKETGGDWRRAIERHAPQRKFDMSVPPAAEAYETRPANSMAAAKPASSRLAYQKGGQPERDRLSFYRTSGGKQYGQLAKTVNSGYKHFKKSSSQP